MDLLRKGIFVTLFLMWGPVCFAGAIPAAKLATAVKIGSAEGEWQKSPKLLVYFWATWCAECREKLGGPLATLSGRTGIPTLLIATDKDPEKIRAFLEDHKVKLPAVHDENRELRKAFSAFSVPTWAVLEKRNDAYEVLGQEAGGDFGKIETLLKGGR